MTIFLLRNVKLSVLLFIISINYCTFEPVKLIIDIGNTVAKLVAFEGEEPIEEVKTSNETLAGLPAFASKYHFDCGIVGSVIGIPEGVEDMLTSMPFPILRFTPDTPIKDILIIDAGTCITYDVIDAKKNYWGGNIAPGMQMRLHALHEYTVRLPLVQAEGEVPGLGYNTETAIRSGVLRGMKYEIEGYIKSMRSKYPHLLVFLTGGDKINFDSNIKNSIFADKFIVSRGLNKILDYNHDKI